MDKYDAMVKQIAQELTRVTANTSVVTLKEAQAIILDCHSDISEYYDALGEMESSPGKAFLYGQVSRWLDFVGDMGNSSSIESMRNKSKYFFSGYFAGKTESTLKIMSEQGTL